MSTTSISTGQLNSASTKGEKMGVASLATKRHLESPVDGDEVVSAKLAKLTQNNNNNNEEGSGVVLLENGDGTNSQIIVQDSAIVTTNLIENSSEFVTTSILARTLLTTSSSGSSSLLGVTSQYSGAADPLESLKSSLEALPAPAILDSHSTYLTSSIGNSKMTIVQNGDSSSLSGFASLLGPERCSPLATAVTTVLSPIDEDPIEWTNPAKATPVMNGITSEPQVHHGMNPSISSLTSLVDHQLQQQLNGVGSHHHLNSVGISPHHEVITEDENGKSYFNLGSSQDSTILARKGSTSSENGWGGSSCGGGGSNNNADFDDGISSSSCDSISSEDLFNSGEEFDASDDDEEEELCSYKQQRSTVLHLSLCKLNKFRTNCVEPSLHRSVLICNTLRHIEQEIRNEDEAADESLKSRERLPSFWPAPPPPSNNLNSQNNCFPPPPNGGIQSQSQPQITDTRPNSLVMGGGLGGGPMQSVLILPQHGGAPTTGMLGGVLPPSAVPNGGHDPYLTPNPYNDAPYLSAYEYNSPRPTPFHTTSYDYEQDLLLPPPPNASPSSTAPSQTSSQASAMLMTEVNGGASSLLECDSGYSTELDMSLSSYYYASPIPPPPPGVSLSSVASSVPITSSHQSSLVDFNGVAMSSSLTGASSNSSASSVVSSSGAIQVTSSMGSSSSNPPTSTQSSMNPYLQCSPNGFQQLPTQQASVVDPIMNSHLLNSASGVPTSSPSSPMEISDIGEIRNGNSSSPSSSSGGGASSSNNNSCEQYTMASNTSNSATVVTTNCSNSNADSTLTTLVQSSSPTSNLSPPTSASMDQQPPESTSPHSLSPNNSPPHQSSFSIPSSTPVVLPPMVVLNTSSVSGTTSISSPPSPSASLANPFAQQDSQCGLESRRSDLSRNVGNHYNNHNLPMDSLISPAYSSSSL